MKKRKIKVWKTAFILVLLLCALWLSSVWVRIYERSPQPDGARGETLRGVTNIMILGLDQEDDEPSRADTIIVMSINNISHDVALVSIPRDSRVEIVGLGLDKINHAMQFGGVPLLQETVETLLDIPIHHYLYTNFSGFESMVDAVGGIEMQVERDIIGLDGHPIVEEGPQHLDGSQALSYARFRSDPEGDFGRMRRQQQVLKAIVAQLIQIKSVVRMPMLLEQFARHIRTDMTLPTLLRFSRTSASLDFENVPTIQLQGRVATIEGISYVLLDQDFLQETVRHYIRWENPTSTNFIAI
ncbi:MAG: LCP family protein [Firmicutes bacterium]|nr:LCP family protein [Bacillota bacterium]